MTSSGSKRVPALHGPIPLNSISLPIVQGMCQSSQIGMNFSLRVQKSQV